jgi:hypothetical protein
LRALGAEPSRRNHEQQELDVCRGGCGRGGGYRRYVVHTRGLPAFTATPRLCGLWRVVVAEDRVENLYKSTRPLVVIGHIPDMKYERFVRFTNRFATPHARYTAFPHFRQVPFLNFLFGRDVFRSPTAAEVERATASARGRKPWPAEESVYVEDGVVIVVLEPYRDGVPITLAAGD